MHRHAAAWGGALLLCSASIAAAPLPAGAESAAGPAVTVLQLVDAETDTVVDDLLPGDAVDRSQLPAFSIVAVTDPPVVGSVVFSVDGDVTQTENVAPYALAGDRNGDFRPADLAPGDYTVTATAFSDRNGGGGVLGTLTVPFVVVDGDESPSLTIDPAGFGFTVPVDGEDVTTYVVESDDGSDLPTPAAMTLVDDATGQPPTWAATTSAANQGVPYELFVFATGLSPGVYTAQLIAGPVAGYLDVVATVTLEVLPAAGLTITPSSLDFEVPVGGGDVAFYTVESNDGSTLPTPAAMDIVDDATGQTATWAATTSAANQGVAYDLFVDATGLTPGVYTAQLIAGPVAGYADGAATITLEVSPSAAVTSFVLVDAGTDAVIGVLTDGAVIDLEDYDGINVVAEVSSTGIGSVVFERDGVVERIENVAPYAIGGDRNGDFRSWDVTPGLYTITATPFLGVRGTGPAGTGLEITIEVVDGP